MSLALEVPLIGVGCSGPSSITDEKGNTVRPVQLTKAASRASASQAVDAAAGSKGNVWVRFS